MKTIVFLFCLTFSLFLLSCSSQDTADIIFTNGKVYTVNETQPWAEAVAVKGNKIIFVGNSLEVEKYKGASTEVVDLEGKMMLPGFVSGHDHLIASNWTKAGVNLFPAKNKEEYLALIKEYADAHPGFPGSGRCRRSCRDRR